MKKGKIEFSLVNILFAIIVVCLVVFVVYPFAKDLINKKENSSADQIAKTAVNKLMMEHFEDFAQIEGVKIFVEEQGSLVQFVIQKQGELSKPTNLTTTQKIIISDLGLGAKYQYYGSALVVMEKSQFEKAMNMGNVIMSGFTTIYETRETKLKKVRNELVSASFQTPADMDGLIFCIDDKSGQYFEASMENGTMGELKKVDKLTCAKVGDLTKVFYEDITVIIPAQIAHLVTNSNTFNVTK